jgi:hypothetical protein
MSPLATHLGGVGSPGRPPPRSQGLWAAPRPSGRVDCRYPLESFPGLIRYSIRAGGEK